MVSEIFEAQTKSVASAVGTKTHDVAEGVQVFRFAVGGKSHHLVFVAKFQEAKILSDAAIIKSERVRECDGIRDLHAVAGSRAPHRAREVAQTVRRKQS